MDKHLENIDIILEHITSLITSTSDQQLLEQLGIGHSQYKILNQFNGDEIIRQNIIATSLGQTEASISRQLKIMNLKGLITRSYDHSNSKAKVVTLTLLGHRMKLAARDIINQQNTELLADMDTKDQIFFLHNIQLIHDNLCNNSNHNKYL